jgi:maltose alpha-D-glucosyltransferase/alpha-amylase
MVTAEERQWMWQKYAPDPRMRLNLGIRRRLAPLLDNDQRKIELLNSLLFTLPGSPIIYYGDEIGMGDNIWLPDRNGVRTPMQWDTSLNAGFSGADPEQLYSPINADEVEKVNVQYQRNDPNSLWHKIKQMIAARKAHPVLGSGDLVWVHTDRSEVAGYFRKEQRDHVLILNNLSEKSISLSIADPALADTTRAAVILGKELSSQPGEQIQITLEPFQFSWIKLS